MDFKFAIVGLAITGASMTLSADYKESHGAHVHGTAQVQIVSENNTLEIHLASPAMNIVGFEHAIKNQEQADSLSESLTVLNQVSQLFSLEGGRCSFVNIEVENPFDEANDADGHDHHDHHDHENVEHHQEHREFEAEYKADCQAISELQRIDFPLLKAFEGIEVLNVEYILQGQQGAISLTKSQTLLELTK